MRKINLRSWALLMPGLFAIIHLSAQLNTNNIDITHIDPNTAANIMLGNSSGVQIFNVVYTGGAEQLGSFSGAGGYIGMTNGIVLATGDSRLAETTNKGSGISCVYSGATLDDGTTLSIGHSFRAEVPIATGYSDADLNALGGNPHNSAVLEFDFVPNATAISFEFIFGSEEYEEYVGSAYNDVFGFFVSGPGITGPYSNGGINIAVVPNTGQPISVNTINAGTNPQYFVANVCNLPNNACPNGCCPCPVPGLQYDGFTHVMTAALDGLECTETYHMRIGITNVSDDQLGSIVFIKGGSFTNNFNAGPVTAEPDIVCEGDMLTLVVEGEQEYEYTWTDVHGNVVSNEQQVTVPATTDGPPYTVTVVDPATGCNKTLSVNPTIHIAANEKPYTKGINNNGDFEYYVPAGVPFSFDIYSFDQENENVAMNILNLPLSVNLNIQPSYTSTGVNHEYVILSAAINYPGEYPFQILLSDDNICGSEAEAYTFKIVVLCPDCYGTTYYERRGLNTTTFPFLPSVTEAQGNIVAGYSVDPTQSNGKVSVLPDVGTVAFYSGQSVNLQPGFIVLPGAHFIAEIREVCDEDCNDCCKDGFTGFTISKDEVPDIFTPDGDGINDYWYIPDAEHPNCAFNIMGFHLTIYNRWGHVVHDVESHTDLCCFYKAPGDAYPNMQFSSIFWDGRVNWPTMGGPYASDGVYDYVLTLYGCENYEETWFGTISVY